MPAIRHLNVVGPASEKCAVALPVRKPNAAYRSREHLTEREVEQLIEAAKTNRWGHRDATMVRFCDGATIRKVEQEVASHIELDLNFPPSLHSCEIVTGPVPSKPIARAAAGDRSISLPRTQGPRSLMRTVTHLP